ncbi:hypothetical protein BDZ97DRAFT_1843827 [Flammula alnicola]|nr:hypothetical protein BDZ97DRAFT_1843827 [Flammula alnicola]
MLCSLSQIIHHFIPMDISETSSNYIHAEASSSARFHSSVIMERATSFIGWRRNSNRRGWPTRLSIKSSVDGSIAIPFSSNGGEISNAHSILVTAINNDFCAMCTPGHIRRPKPKKR